MSHATEASPYPTPATPTDPTTDTTPRIRDAYDRLLDEIKKVSPSEFLPINVDIQAAVTTALGALPNIVALRPRIVAMPEFDIAQFDKLELYIRAAGYAQSLWVLASKPAEPIDDLYQEAVEKRAVLFKDASALAQRNLIDGEKFGDLKGPVGFRNVAFDLLSLSGLLRNSWSAIGGKTALTLDEIDSVQELADRLLTAVGLREQGPAVVAEAASIRQGAFTLFANAYDHARRAVTFLRWTQEDVDEIAPSLYAGRATGKHKDGSEQPTPPAVPTAPSAPSGPVVSPVTPPTNGGLAAKSVGLPDSEPFVAR
jgi:hypothetical protein